MTAKVLDFKKNTRHWFIGFVQLQCKETALLTDTPMADLSSIVIIRLSFCFAFRKESGKLMLNVENHYYDWRPVFTSTVCSISL